MIDSTRRWLDTLRIWRLEKRRESSLRLAGHYRQEAARLAAEAYDMDQFATPMAWGRTQNAANWAKHHERAAMRIVSEIDRRLSAPKGDSNG